MRGLYLGVLGSPTKSGRAKMKAIEVTGKIDAQGNLILDQPIQGTTYPDQVRVIVLIPEQEETEEFDPDDTPVEEIKASLRRALQQAKMGQTRPISELWDRIDAE
ncbi:all4408 [Nostoc sp. PCC 7120 = FACHB-418]|nr:all4408 [Nostoc sp. PCC 7120 = FACHB-418]